MKTKTNRRILFAISVCCAGFLVALAAFGQGKNRSTEALLGKSRVRVHVTHAAEPFAHRSAEILSESEQATAPAPVTRSSFMARWKSVPGASGYRLDVSTSPAFDNFVQSYRDVDVGKATGRVVTGLRRGTTYCYRVRAYNAFGTRTNSATTTVTTEPSTGLIISPYFDLSIVNDPNAAAIEAMIIRAISIYESLFRDPIIVHIAFRWTTTPDPCGPIGGLAQSCTDTSYLQTWNQYINALRADAQTSNDNMANASLPSSMLTSTFTVSSANLRAIGFPTPGTLPYNGGLYDGTVTLNSSYPFQFTRPIGANNYDAQRATEHEIDEVLGFGSDINTSSNYMPQDLFSWSSAGVRSHSSSGIRYFSINSGVTNIVGFNQDTSGDLGDWFSESCPQSHPYVQNAFGCRGQSSDVTASSPEGINLDVIGYDLGTTPPEQCDYTISQVGAAGFVAGTADTGNHCHDCESTFSLPFTYMLYGQPFTSVNVRSNGRVNFDSHTCVGCGNGCLPEQEPVNSILAYWDDLRTDASSGCAQYPGGQCGIFTSVSGLAPNRIFNIDFRTVYYSNPGQLAEFEVRLYEGQQQFDVIYVRADQGNTSATGGVEKQSGRVTQYFCNGTGNPASGGQRYLASCNTGASNWAVRALGDFNRDGKSDYALYDTHTFQTAILYLNNNAFVGGAYGPTLPAGWTLVAVGDFNGDGKPDYVLSNASTRQTAIWYLNNNAFVNSAYGPTPPAGWSLVAVGDFNRDGKLDYVLSNASTRQTAIWYLNNNALISGVYGPTLPGGWSLVAVGDFNGDGKPDYVLFDASTRQTAIWYLNNNAFISGAYGPTLPAGWSLVAVGDFNRDGKPDYVLSNASTRQTAIWYLNNNAFISGAYGPTL